MSSWSPGYETLVITAMVMEVADLDEDFLLVLFNP